MTLRTLLSSVLHDVESSQPAIENQGGWIASSELPPSEQLDDFAALVVGAIGDDEIHAGRVVRVRRKLRKMLFELEVSNGEMRPQRYFGKMYRQDRGGAQFDALQCLRHAGFRPPSPFTVVRPIRYVREYFLLLQEKAPGRPLAEIMSSANGEAEGALALASRWLTTLHSKVIDCPSRVEHITTAASRFGRELAEALPREAARLDRLTSRLVSELGAEGLPLAPSHGDFHSKNVFVTDDGRVTAIDLDTFGRQEPAADVAYFLAQTAIIGYHHHRSFAVTRRQRDFFLRCYLDASPHVNRDRLAVHLAATFLQSLHYEMCVLHTENAAIVEPWVDNIERLLLEGDVDAMDRLAN